MRSLHPFIHRVDEALRLWRLLWFTATIEERWLSSPTLQTRSNMKCRVLRDVMCHLDHQKLCEDFLQQNWITCIVTWSMWRTNRKLHYFFEVKWDLFLRFFQTVRFVWRYFQRHCWKHQCNYPSWVVSVRYWQCRCWWWRFAKAIGSSGRLHCWSILAGYATDPNKNGTVGESFPFRVVQLLKMFLPRYGIFLVRSQAKHPWESET